MARQTIFCKHYRAMASNDTCEAGVAYEQFKGSFDKCPCFQKNGVAPPGCDLAQFPTAEEIAAEDAEFEKLFQRTIVARNAIVAHLGGPWKRGMAGSAGKINCPACGGVETLKFSRSGYNGHIHAACSTEDCVQWME